MKPCYVHAQVSSCKSLTAEVCGTLQVLIDAVVHAVNEDYDEMAGDFIKLGFLSPGMIVALCLASCHLAVACEHGCGLDRPA